MSKKHSLVIIFILVCVAAPARIIIEGMDPLKAKQLLESGAIKEGSRFPELEEAVTGVPRRRTKGLSNLLDNQKIPEEERYIAPPDWDYPPFIEANLAFEYKNRAVILKGLKITAKSLPQDLVNRIKSLPDYGEEKAEERFYKLKGEIAKDWLRDEGYGESDFLFVLPIENDENVPKESRNKFPVLKIPLTDLVYDISEINGEIQVAASLELVRWANINTDGLAIIGKVNPFKNEIKEILMEFIPEDLVEEKDRQVSKFHRISNQQDLKRFHKVKNGICTESPVRYAKGYSKKIVYFEYTCKSDVEVEIGFEVYNKKGNKYESIYRDRYKTDKNEVPNRSLKFYDALPEYDLFMIHTGGGFSGGCTFLKLLDKNGNWHTYKLPCDERERGC